MMFDDWTSSSSSSSMGLFKEDRDFFEPASPMEQLEQEWNSDSFFNLIFGAVLGIIFLILLSLCFKRCASDMDDEDENTKKNTIIAQEIKPGMIVIQGGTREEQMRIIQEYETIRMQQHQQHQQQQQQHLTSHPAAANYGTTHQLHLQQPAPGHYMGSAPTEQSHLIDFDPDRMQHPPPYAPRQ